MLSYLNTGPQKMATRISISSVVLLAALLLGPIGCDYTAIYFYSTCTGVQSALPNLSYARATATGQVTWTCSNAGAYNGYAQSLNWYYYTSYPPSGDCAASPPPDNQCCHAEATSIITYTTSTFANTPTSVIETSVGTVTSGPFQGLKATLVATSAAYSAACLNQTGPGVEARSGTVVLTLESILPLTQLTCSGVVTLEMCPGVHTAI